MARKRKQSSLPIIHPEFSDILVCQNSNFRPNIESFFYEPENISQQNMGILFGVLEITDMSEDSSYIVNYLISVIKKEFYKNTKRGGIESFEASLHRANLALSKLAQHENIGWINNIHAIIGIIEKNNIHLSQAGKGIALILRKENLINISDDTKKETEFSPLKTFEDIISGKIEEQDKMILATPEIFEIFSEQEIKKSAKRFDKEKFIQFLKTALTNELERNAVLVINFGQRAKSPSKKTKSSPEELANVFSQKAFKEKLPKDKPKKTAPWEKDSKNNEKITVPKKNEEKNHLYIKEGLDDLSTDTLDKIESKVYETKNGIEKFKKTITAKTNLKKFTEKIATAKFKDTFKKSILIIYPLFKKVFSHIIRFSKKNIYFLVNISKLTYKKIYSFKKRPPTKIKNVRSSSSITKINFQKITSFYKNLSWKQSLVLILILIFILVLPLFLIQKKNNTTIETPVQTETSPESNSPLVENFDEIEFSNLNNYSEKNNNQEIVLLGDNIFAIGENYIFDTKNQKLINIPESTAKIKSTVAMDDLNLLLLFTQDNKVISFSPLTNKLQNNVIDLPQDSNLDLIGTYLTYLYFINQSQNQIYRYPRAEGGFGEKTNWLNESFVLSDVASATINESIFILKEKKIIKFFKGFQENFEVADIKQPSLIFSQEDYQNLYILDKNNNKFFIVNNEGDLLKEFTNEKFFQVKKIQVDEEKKAIFLLLDDGEIIKFEFTI